MSFFIFLSYLRLIKKTLVVIIFIPFIISSCIEEENEINALFVLEDDLLFAGEYLELLNMSDSIGVKYYWDFGDGNHSTKRFPLHSYSTPGKYCIQLTATNNFGNSSSIIRCLKVGKRFVYEIELLHFNNFKHVNNEVYWDEGSIDKQALPDIFITIVKDESEVVLYKTELKNNYNQKDLPTVFKIPEVEIQANPFRDWYRISNAYILYDKDSIKNEIMMNNRLSGVSFSGVKYDKNSHTGEFIVSRISSVKIKYLIR